MLPVRLGMLNARGPQDLVVYALTRNGRVETTNYRTVRVPSNVELPTYVRGEFPAFYKALFATQSQREDYRVVWTEYFWDMTWCDPCAADPLSADELKGAGVFWLEGDAATISGAPATQRPRASGAQPVLLTRLHLRYSRRRTGRTSRRATCCAIPGRATRMPVRKPRATSTRSRAARSAKRRRSPS